MNKRHQSLTLFLVLLIALSGVSCSNDEPEAVAESNEQAHAETPALDSPTEEDALGATGDEFIEDEDPAPTVDLASAYDEECDSGKDTSLDCEVLRSLLVVEVAMALEEIERSGDQRGTEEALAALDLTWEPEILIAACRVLGRFPDTPGIAEKVTPLMLDSPYPAVEQIAAQLLSQNPDPVSSAMGRQWYSGQGGLWTDNPYEPAPNFPEHYFDMGFPEYPDAEWFSPADSDRSVGWWVAGTPAEVSARLANELGVESMTYEQWAQRSSAEMMSAYTAMMEDPQAAELQQVMEKYMQTQDPALAERMYKMQEEMAARRQKIEDDADKALNNVLSPPGGAEMENLSYLVAEEKDGHISRAIMVFRFAGSERTVMRMAWDLRDYPPAWAKPE